MWNINAASFTPRPIAIATAETNTISCGIFDSSISAKSKLPMVRPIINNPNSKTTAPACVQKKNIKLILLLGPSPQSAIKKKAGSNIISKKIKNSIRFVASTVPSIPMANTR